MNAVTALHAAKVMLLIPVTALTLNVPTPVSAHVCQCMPFDAMQQLVSEFDGKQKYMSHLLSNELLWLYRSTDVLAGTVLHSDMLRSIIGFMKSLRGGLWKMKGYMVHMHNCVCVVPNTHVSVAIQCTQGTVL